jgi:hypothetical protein
MTVTCAYRVVRPTWAVDHTGAVASDVIAVEHVLDNDRCCLVLSTTLDLDTVDMERAITIHEHDCPH